VIERSLFIEALEIADAGERRDFITRRTENDRGLRSRVLRLIESYDVAPDFLERPAVAAAAGRLDSVDAASQSDTHPTSIGDYRIVRLVGRGGMGQVYEAIHAPLGRRVALKVVSDSAARDPRAQDRFDTEAKAAARLHHTNIVPVYDVGCSNGVRFYSMQYIEGEPLDRVIRALRDRRDSGGPSSWSEFIDAGVEHLLPDSSSANACPQGVGRRHWRRVASIAMQAADAIEFAHREGVLHRDVKPANVIVDRQGNAWVTDFGVAKVDGSDLTRTGDVVGTLRFMAPERFQGASDARSDVYSLGAMLYELLTLRPAHDDTDRVSLLRRIQNDTPPAPRRLDHRVPRDLEVIALHAMAIRPGNRYATAGAMRDDLGRFLEGRPIRARRVGPVEGVVRWSRRQPAVAALLATVFGLGGATIATLAVSNAIVRESDQRRAVALDETKRALRTVESSRAAARARLYASQLSMAGAAFHAGDWGRVLNLLDSQIPSDGEEDLRGFEWRYLWREVHKAMHAEFPGAGGEASSLAFSPDGKALATAHGSFDLGVVQLWDVDRRKRRHLLYEGGSPANGLAFSPSADQLLAGLADGELRVWNSDTGEVDRSFRAGGLIRSADWSPDGRWAAAGFEDGGVRLWRADARWAAGPALDGLGGPVLSLTFSANSDQLHASAQWGKRGPISVRYDLSVDPPRAHETPNRFVSDARGPGGEHVSFDWSDIVIHGATGDPLETAPRVCVGCLSTVDLSPDGTRLVTAGHDDRMAILWDRKTQSRLVQGAHRTAVWSAAIDPQQRHWATGSLDGYVRVWRYEPSEAKHELPHSPPILNVLPAPNGKALLLGMFPVQEWDGSTKPKRVVLQTPGRIASRDARWIVGLRDGLRDGKRLVIADHQAKRIIREIPLPDDQLLAGESLAISDDGALLAARCWGGPVRFWDLKADPPRSVGQVEGFECLQLAFSPDGKRLAAACQFGRVGLIDVAARKPLADIEPPEALHVWAQRLAYSPDGRYLAASDDVGVVRVWRTGSWELAASLVGHLGEVSSLAFLPDSRRLAVAGVGPIRLWDVAIGQECLHLPAGDKTNAMAISVTGDAIYAVDDRGTARVWRADPLPTTAGQ
jgi:serine/threonine protein kinase/WD40 repeat protein